MSEETVALARRGLDVFNRRDSDAWIVICDPGVENFPPRDWPESSPLRGPEAIWDFFVASQDSWEEGSYEFREVIELSPDTVAADMHREVRGKTSGASIDWSYWVVFTFRDRRLLRMEWFSDRDEAVEAATDTARP